MAHLRSACLALIVALVPLEANSQDSTQAGRLSCDVSAGIGMFVVEKQTLSCVFQDRGGKVENYTGSIDQFGVALGEVAEGHLIWGVIAASSGVPAGALAGTYSGVGANASIGLGAGANVLVGGSGRAFSLQPISVEGQTGINIAGGVTTMTLRAAP
ncbi:DUF992 domain-containing protein [Mesorhizobium onobrychidis]|uniref:DUF992 domain-containing protein n=1 Tax=Mesorhizobium onobrychidis TaxID=2775404 RepID=A0ABY5QRK7_9HYPH|nr:DUF992 domain-containing protein [Mesorhizobium onobrychidis]UVC13374.1 DUF992 domain-containing protein [Mesorhizobium onobrychidis]